MDIVKYDGTEKHCPVPLTVRGTTGGRYFDAYDPSLDGEEEGISEKTARELRVTHCRKHDDYGWFGWLCCITKGWW